MEKQNLKNKLALITGASSGIGAAIAMELAKEKFEIIINYSHSKKKAEEIKNKIQYIGGTAYIFRADITKKFQVERMFRYIAKKFGALDVLINNAGVYIPNYIESMNFKNFDKVLNLNLKAKLLCVNRAIPLLAKAKSPRVINIATRAAVKPMIESTAYCCAAAAIIMLTQVMVLELKKYNIRVNSVSPGLTHTSMTDSIDSKEEFEDYIANNPANRIGTPEDIAHIVSFMVSDPADYINGENINIIMVYNGLGKLDNPLRYNWWYNNHLCEKHLPPIKKSKLPSLF